MNEKDVKARLKTRLDGWQAYLTTESLTETPPESAPAPFTEVDTEVNVGVDESVQEIEEAEEKEARRAAPSLPQTTGADLPAAPYSDTVSSDKGALLPSSASETKSVRPPTVPPSTRTEDLLAGGIAAYLDTLSQERARGRGNGTIPSESTNRPGESCVDTLPPADKQTLHEEDRETHEETVRSPPVPEAPSIEQEWRKVDQEWQKQGLRKHVVLLSLLLTFLAGVYLFFLYVLSGK
jgi:hypothetical protein